METGVSKCLKSFQGESNASYKRVLQPFLSEDHKLKMLP
jgi:hypothetical protein